MITIPMQPITTADLQEALRMIPAERRPELLILGVEPAVIDYGLELSAPVRAALPGFLDAVRKMESEMGSDLA